MNQQKILHLYFHDKWLCLVMKSLWYDHKVHNSYEVDFEVWI